jgi:hypothetical protein
LQQWLWDWLDGRTLFNIYEKPAHPVPPPPKIEPRPTVINPEAERLRKIGLEGMMRFLGIEREEEE